MTELPSERRDRVGHFAQGDIAVSSTELSKSLPNGRQMRTLRVFFTGESAVNWRTQ